MGTVYLSNTGLIKELKEESLKYKLALIAPGQSEAEVKLASLSSEEVKLILLKLDSLALEKANPLVALMIAEEAESILTAIRMVKVETKEAVKGILGAGSNLDIKWLRPKDVGGPLLRGTAAAGTLGLYGGAGGAVYTWLQTFVANTAQTMIPSQTMAEEAAVIHLGAIDPVDVPKLSDIMFTLAGIPTGAQSLACNIRSRFADEPSVVRFEKPVIVGPEKTQKIDVMPNISGDSKFQLLSLLIAKVENLTL